MHDKKISPSATLWVIAAVQFLTPFMFSAIGVALPTIGREFSSNAVQLGLVEMVYILGVALFLLPVGRFADIHGRRKMFLSGIILITLATLALSFAPTIETLILFRFFQGIGASMITSSSFAILTSVYPKEQRGRALGVVVSAVYLGISAGPTLAGLMISYLGWRWIFYSAIPVELAALVFALTRLKGEWADARGERFDWIGSLLYMTALCALIVGVLEIKQFQAASWLAGAGLVGMAFFLFYETRFVSPLLPLKIILANRIFVCSNLATWLNYAASFGIMFLLQPLSPDHQGHSAQDHGLHPHPATPAPGCLRPNCRQTCRPLSAGPYRHSRNGLLHPRTGNLGPAFGLLFLHHDLHGSHPHGTRFRFFFHPQFHCHHGEHSAP